MWKVLLIVLTFFTSSSVWANWVLVGETHEAKFFIDYSTIRKEGSLSKVWQMTNLNERGSDGEMSVRTRNEYDCKEERRRIIDISTHTGVTAQGRTLLSDSSPGAWTYIAPKTINEMILKIICNK